MSHMLPHAKTVKFLVILRDPIERTVSGYFQASRQATIKDANRLAVQEVDLLNEMYNSTLSLDGVDVRGSMIHNAEACVDGHLQYQRLNAWLTKHRRTAKPWYLRYIRKTMETEMSAKAGVMKLYEVGFPCFLVAMAFNFLLVKGACAKGNLRGSA